MSEQDTNKGITRYVWEYSQFLEFVKKRKVQRAVIYAQMLGIDRRTFVHWLNQPELREAMAESIDELVEGMQKAGSKDWRMYRELMEIMGIQAVKNVDVTSGGEKLPPTVIIEGAYGGEPKFRIDNTVSEADDLATGSGDTSGPVQDS